MNGSKGLIQGSGWMVGNYVSYQRKNGFPRALKLHCRSMVNGQSTSERREASEWLILGEVNNYLKGDKL